MIQSALAIALVSLGQSSDPRPEPASPTAIDGGPVLADTSPELTFEFTPGVWLMRVRGTASNGPGNAPELQLDTQLGLTDLVTAFRGEAVISRGDLSVWIAGSTLSSSGSRTADEFARWGSIALAPGDRFSSSFDMSFVASEARWEAWTPLGEATVTERNPLRLGLGPHVGISWIDIDQTVTTALQEVSNGGSWWTVWGGGQLEFEFDMKRFVSWIDSIRVQATAGLGGTPSNGGFMWHAGGGAEVFFTPHLAASIQYRYEKYTLEDGDWNLSPNFQGLFLGATIRF